MVNSLVDAPGSSTNRTLRYAIEGVSGPKAITFDSSLSGTITLNTELVLDDSFVTIDGSTAAGAGITIQGQQFKIRNAHDILVRYLRFRSGDTPTGFHCNRSILISAVGQSVNDICLDHLSIGPSRDDNLAIAGPVCGVTIQNCLIGGGKIAGSKAGLLDGNQGDLGTSGSFTICHSLITNTAIRQLSITYRGRVDFFNNVVGVSNKSLEMSSGLDGLTNPMMNIINCYFRTANTGWHKIFHDPITATEYYGAGAAPISQLKVSGNNNTIYVSGNHFESYESGAWAAPYGSTEHWKLTEEVNNEDSDLTSTLQKSSAWTMPNDNADLTLTAAQVKASVLANAGCRLPLSNPALDTYDQSLVAAYETGEKLYPEDTNNTVNTLPGIARIYLPLDDSSFSNPIPVPTTLSWYDTDETETYQVQQRLYIAPPDPPSSWNTIGYVNSPGTAGTLNIDCTGHFDTNKSYEWRVIGRNTCYSSGLSESLIPIWKFRTCSAIPCP